MKRFYKAVEVKRHPSARWDPRESLVPDSQGDPSLRWGDDVGGGGDGFEILLDNRTVRTPARAALVLPNARLAEAVAAEWEAQNEDIDPRSMPLTGLANAAIDQVAPDCRAFAEPLARYAETELLCYRADTPASLVAAQAAAWDPLLAWAESRYDVAFTLVEGVIHRPQPPATVARLGEAITARDAFELAALSPIVTISGSLVIALAILKGALDPEAAFDAAHLDALWQEQRWGADAEALKARSLHRRDFDAACRFLRLLDDDRG